MKTHPYYRRTCHSQALSQFNFDRIDLSFAHLPPYATPGSFGRFTRLAGCGERSPGRPERSRC